MNANTNISLAPGVAGGGTFATFLQAVRGGLATPILVVAILGMLLLPLPPLMLDIFFTFNISLSLVVLLVAVYTLRPLHFAVFPTVLLIATMLRLALNVASTRVMLVEGHNGSAAAGQVIESFGEFVVRGNFAVGLVVFAILVIINFVVVTKGAGRVSEVSARFTLDSMPGKQMAIDADLNAGVISQEEAKVRREDITREADFYGAMDGASKFVRGDAIAGMLILMINILGGLAIGMGQHQMAFSEALPIYALLTVGDGIVAQVPSLLLSIATAIIVTRVSSAQSMGDQMMSQMFQDPRSLVVTSGIIGTLGLVPGMPNIAFLSVAGLAGFAAWWMHTRGPAPQEEAATDAVESEPEPADLGWEDVKPVDPIGLEIGYRLIQLVEANRNGALMGRIKGVRRKLSQELGFLVPPVHIRDNLDLSQNAYRLSVRGIAEADVDVYPDRELAIDPGGAQGQIQGIATKDPAFGMDAVWISGDQRDHALAMGFTVVDASTVIATHLSRVLHDRSAELLGYEEAKKLLDGLEADAPKLVEELVPKSISLGTFVLVLRSLLLEHVPLSDVRTIAEALAAQAPKSQDIDALVGAVRVALRRTIVQKINGIQDELPIVTLDARLEQLLQKSFQPQRSEDEPAASIEPSLAERLQRSLRNLAEHQELSGEPAVLVVAPTIRSWIAKLYTPSIKNLYVLAYTEIPDDKQVRIVATVGEEVIAPSNV